MTMPDRAPVVGTRVSMTTYSEVFETIADRPKDRAVVVAVCNVHSVMSARSDADLKAALDDSDIATPDGVPLVWALRWTANPKQDRVYGPEIMRRALADEEGYQWRHYLYGSTEDTLKALVDSIEHFAPNARIVGQTAPPFRSLTEEEETQHIEAIRQSNPDIVWVGLGMPTQELWMASVRGRLPGVALIGVGAAFDILAGTVKQAPRWMQRAGIEWIYRLLQEPRRLWRRYVWNNPAFVVLLAWQILTSWSRPRRAQSRR